MHTWGNLLTGFSPMAAFLADHPNPLVEMWAGGFFKTFVWEWGYLLPFFGLLIMEIVAIGLIPLTATAFLYNLFAPLIRRLGQW